MTAFGPPLSPGVAGRRILATATITAAVLGFVADGRWFAAAGAFGIAWWAWDVIWANVLGPLGGWFMGMLTGTYDGATGGSPPGLSLDDTIRLLEDHVRSDAVPRHVQIQSALRLAEIYRLNRQEERSREVLALVRTRWPDAPELQRTEPPDAGAPPGLGDAP